MIALPGKLRTIGENSVSSPEPRELPSPVQLGKDFRPTVDKDFSARVLPAREPITPEQVAAPKAPVLSVTTPVVSQTSEDSSATDRTDLIPLPEDLTAPVEPGPSQLPSEEESLPASSSATSPGVFVPPVLASKTPTSSSPNEAK